MTSDLPGTSPAAAAPPPAAPPAADFFDRIRGLGLIRPGQGRWFSGVAAGISRRTGLDVVLVRGAIVALVVVGGAGVLLYGLAWLLLPEEDGRIHLQEALRGHVSAGLLGSGLFIVLGTTAGPWSGHWGWFGPPPGLLLLLVAGGLIWWGVQRNRRPGNAQVPPVPPGSATFTHTAPPVSPYGAGAVPPVPPVPFVPPAPAPRKRDLNRPSHRWTLTVIGAALTTAGVLLLIDLTGGHWLDDIGVAAAAVALGIVALGVIGAGLVGRRSGLLFPLGFLLALAVIGGSVGHGSNASDGVGDRTWTPTSVDQLDGGYRLFVGDGTLRLDDPALIAEATPGGSWDTTVRMGAGDLTVVVPENLPVTLDIDLGAGEIQVPGEEDFRTEDAPSDWNHQRVVRTGPDEDPRITVDVQMGVGQITVQTVAPDGRTTSALLEGASR